MKDKPLVSVLMPVYNAERYVKEAVESILAQTFKDFEFLITDDGSTDRSLEILKHYAAKDPRIQLTSRPNAGLVATLNEMLEKAQGEFIARMDADDIALPTRFQLQIDHLRTHPEIVVIGGAQEIIDERGRLLLVNRVKVANQQVQEAALAGVTPICHPTAMMRRMAVMQVGGYKQDSYPAEDLDLWLRLGEIGELENLHDVVLKYRIHTNSISSSAHTKQMEVTRKVCEAAWAQRGIQGVLLAREGRPGTDRNSRYDINLKWGWWAFNTGEWSTTLSYGLKVIRINPLRLGGWKLVYCALFKRKVKKNALN